jgi:imidazole glycerol-phosphate synthase subunit HisH
MNMSTTNIVQNPPLNIKAGAGNKVIIIQYNAGNIQSVSFALERLGIHALITDNFEEMASADKIIFPGVGAANSAMNSLKEKGLEKIIPTLKQPVLGICVGMQLLCKYSEENNTNCLNVLPYRVKRFPTLASTSVASLKVPQVGWNNIYDLKSPLLNGIPENSFVYNVHSYYVEMNQHCIATAQYGLAYAAAIQKNNFYGVQFHTEKSAQVGASILHNFLTLT